MTQGKSKQTFLFINKDSSSSELSKSSTSDEKASILSHVQRRRRKLARGKKAQEVWAALAGELEPEEPNQPKPRAYPTHLTVMNNRSSRISNPTRSVSPFSICGSSPRDNATDPFYATAVGDMEGLHYNLHVCAAQTANTTYTAEAFAPEEYVQQRRPFRHAEFLVDRLKAGVHNAMLMHATLLLGSNMLAWTTGVILPGQSSEYYNTQTLSAIREHLMNVSKADDQWTIVTIAVLALTTMWRGLPEHWTRCPQEAAKANASYLDLSRVHLKAAVTLVESTCGWIELHPYVFESLLINDKYLSMNSESQNCVPMDDDLVFQRLLRWCPLEESGTNFLLRFNLLIRRSSELVSESHLPEFCSHTLLHQNVNTLLNYIQLATSLWEEGNVEPFEQSYLYLQLQRIEIGLGVTLSKGLNLMDRCICLNLIILTNLATFHYGGTVSARAFAARLKTTLQQAEKSSASKSDTGLWFWLHCMGALVELTEEGKDQDAWFCPMLTKFCKARYLFPTIEGFTNILTQFVWPPERLQKKLGLLVEKMQMDWG